MTLIYNVIFNIRSLFAEPELTMMIAVLACHPPSVPTLIMKPLHVTYGKGEGLIYIAVYI